jgi:2-keto-4-pentenoate hydratase/2-oxohepta-3-ene-1,7-dioic acid hydratase in catechol pathway
MEKWLKHLVAQIRDITFRDWQFSEKKKKKKKKKKKNVCILGVFPAPAKRRPSVQSLVCDNFGRL